MATPIIDWETQPLGHEPDWLLALRLRVHRTTVGQARRARGIPPKTEAKRPCRIPWDNQPLGRKSDGEIARHLGVSDAVVRKARVERHRSAFGAPGFAFHATRPLPGAALPDQRLGSTSIDWNTQPLGRIPDSVLARRLKVSVSSVRSARRARKVPRWAPKPSISPDLVPLGMFPDRAIGHLLGKSRLAVAYVRRRLGIPAFQPHKSGVRGINWDRIDLGHAPDSRIAARLGCDPSTVGQARKHRGIAVWSETALATINWGAQTDLGKVPDQVLARRLGCPACRVREERFARGLSHRHVDWDQVPELGAEPDPIIARRYGVTSGAVLFAREKRGIPACRKPRGVPAAPRVTVNWDLVADLGKVADGVIARKLGVGRNTVREARVARDIPAAFDRGVRVKFK